MLIPQFNSKHQGSLNVPLLHRLVATAQQYDERWNTENRIRTLAMQGDVPTALAILNRLWITRLRASTRYGDPLGMRCSLNRNYTFRPARQAADVAS
ncbi:unnamed protein product [Mycetohabitans rhizoxinica HKI 454]|uniref:Transposase n=1 Tax=Mycetohabitans rhizoxinica (strain DSM 19002 / CIP 109453 / HKI 454) TaxID=882378 RepID=E5AQE7_MYCRK|nr:unnamed protein product [Mycetohabitans rhizoxinica HKI 454]